MTIEDGFGGKQGRKGLKDLRGESAWMRLLFVLPFPMATPNFKRFTKMSDLF